MKLTDEQKKELEFRFMTSFSHPERGLLCVIVQWWLSQIEQLETELPNMEEFAKQRAMAFFKWYFKDCTEDEYLKAVSAPTSEETYDMFMRSQLKTK